MAIKRPTKSRGTPSRTAVASVAVRHVIALPPAGSKVAVPEFDDQLTAIKCPHCGDEDLYRWSARSEHEYTPNSAGN